jgi:hypothetical protein
LLTDVCRSAVARVGLEKGAPLSRMAVISLPFSLS